MGAWSIAVALRLIGRHRSRFPEASAISPTAVGGTLMAHGSEHRESWSRPNARTPSAPQAIPEGNLHAINGRPSTADESLRAPSIAPNATTARLSPELWRGLVRDAPLPLVNVAMACALVPSWKEFSTTRSLGAYLSWHASPRPAVAAPRPAADSPNNQRGACQLPPFAQNAREQEMIIIQKSAIVTACGSATRTARGWW